MRFRVEMWNEKIPKDVVDYITELTGQPVKSSQVQVIPFEKVIVTTSSPSNSYWLPKDWLPYQSHRFLWISLFCFSETEGRNMAECMRIDPDQFSHLKLLFILSSQTSMTRETVISIENIASGQLASSLNRCFPKEKDALISVQDEKRLLAESTAKIVVEALGDYDVVSKSSEVEVYNMLKDLLIISRITIKNPSDPLWNSVYWSEEINRPDKATKIWNEVYKNLNKEDQRKLSDAFNNTN